MWRNAMDERRVAETIADLSRHAPLWPKMSEIQGLYDHQRERLAIATQRSGWVLDWDAGDRQVEFGGAAD
jgi:hypothetical protein